MPQTRASTRILTAVFAVVVAALLSGAPAIDGANGVFRIEPLALPAASVSAQPQLTVTGDRAIVSWIERTGKRAILRFAERSATGWSEARMVASGDDWFVNWADVPSVVRLADGTLAAHWLQTTDADLEGYDLRLSFSRDEGRTWTSSITPHHDGTKTEHGFASLFQMPGAGLGVVWLDGRAIELETEKGHEDMSLRAAVFDRDGRQISEALIDDRVCDCCPTAVAVTSDGPIAAFRDRSAEEMRDIAISRRVDGRWSTPEPVHGDGWTIAACPVNGPALSARDRQVAIAWFTVKDDQGRAFAAFSRDAGATFGDPIRLDAGGSLGRVDVDLLADGSAVASWIELTERRAQFRIRHLKPSGERSAAQTVAEIGADRASGYPRLARHGHEILLAWTETRDGRSHVRTAVATLEPGR